MDTACSWEAVAFRIFAIQLYYYTRRFFLAQLITSTLFYFQSNLPLFYQNNLRFYNFYINCLFYCFLLLTYTHRPICSPSKSNLLFSGYVLGKSSLPLESKQLGSLTIYFSQYKVPMWFKALYMEFIIFFLDC